VSLRLPRSTHRNPPSDPYGGRPEPPKTRLALAKLLAALPVELALHALVAYRHPPYLVTVTVLAISSTALLIWVFEPAVTRALRTWLHSPAQAAARRLHGAEALWRVRATLPGHPDSAGRLARSFAERDLDVLGIHGHTLPDQTRDEFVLAAPRHVPAEVITRTAANAGGADIRVWPTTALALTDEQTRALALAARVTADRGELPMALAQLLGARSHAAPDPQPADALGTDAPDDTRLAVSVPGHGTVILDRPGRPFTPTEAARARRLAEIAGTAHTGRRDGEPPPPHGTGPR
jgi:hypothetical protein